MTITLKNYIFNSFYYLLFQKIQLLMQDQQIQYIMKSEIGQLLCKGFAQLYRQKPEFPISYLAEWLIAQGRKKLDYKQIAQTNKQQEKYKKELRELEEIRKRKNIATQKQKKEPFEQEKKNFIQLIKKEEFVEDMLIRWLPEYIQVKKEISGCYIGLLTAPRKKIAEGDQEQKAHLDLQAPKVIYYIGSSKSNEKIMIGATLPADKGISAQVFKISEDQPPVQGNEQQQKQPPKPKYIYVPNVLKQQKINFFRLPKLGSFAVFPLIIKTYLTEQSFEKGIDQYKKYLQQKQQIEKQRLARLNQLKTELEEFEKKNQQHLETEQHLLLRKNYQDFLKKPAEIPEPNFPYQKKEYVVGCDTLGQDREIPLNILNEIQDLLVTFGQNWQQTEKNHLLKDITTYSSYTTSLQTHAVDISEQANQQIEGQARNQIGVLKQKFSDERQLHYELDQLKLIKARTLLNQKFMKYLFFYPEYYIPKFKNILQTIFYFAGYTKEQINFPQTNELNWRSVRKLITTDLVQKLVNYEHRGIKNPVPSYARISKLIERFEKFDLEAVISYNLGLWMLAKITKLNLSLRNSHREITVQKHEAKKRDRNNKIEEKARIQQQMIKSLEIHRSSLQGESLETFNENEWILTYHAEHPLPQIPEEIQFVDYHDI